ncbi:subtilisin-like protease SBT3.6 isoform X2 [Punica granatum]|uniref:Subtilisin-like protease SBT3.6 isoform X2 n=1 Tax=Punica granatum TaxID=22663 RepID=A0A6P8DJQ7_PUNGR|nr:subtilisin-like protease SBT3.6 isoform X2 [Punica granatum]
MFAKTTRSSTMIVSLLSFGLLFNFQSSITGTAIAEGKTSVHIVYLGEREHDNPELVTSSHHDMLASVLGSKESAAERLVYSYRHGFSGFAAKLTESQARKLADFPGVVRVMRNSLYRIQTTRSWDFLGLSSPPVNNLLYESKMGDGIIIGVLDTGIWPESESFTDKGLGPVPSYWNGTCEPGEQFDPVKHCNRKIIGARWYVKGILAEYGRPLNSSGDTEFMSPRDAVGHGTHTASIAAGSFVRNVSYKGVAHGTARGGAPRARLAIYKVCWNVLGGQCSSVDILKAFDEAIHDGVHVMSLSIGSSIPLFSEVDDHDGIATGSFHAMARGITVVCGAANDGPSAQTVQNTAPWILTVAASTMDRDFQSLITLGNNEVYVGQALYTGKEIGFASLVYPDFCRGLTPNVTLFAGRVVLCFTSSARRAAITIAAAAVRLSGGIGLIAAKSPSDGLAPCSDDFPCVEVDYETGTSILYYFRSERSPTVKISPTLTVVNSKLPAHVAHFSSRGPNSIAPAILKPDIAAPGVNILAASSPLDPLSANGYAMHTGTSMSTPHVAGIVALLKALHLDWSPAMIKSSIITTGWKNHPTGFPIQAAGSPQKVADPFDYGGGIINPNGAAWPGLVYDMAMTDYINYLCHRGYNESDISRIVGQPTICQDKSHSILDTNLPSITIPNLASLTTVMRTVTNVGPQMSTYWALIEPPPGTTVTVCPNVLVFNATAQKITFKVTVRLILPIVESGYIFGSLKWSNGVNHVTSPLIVRVGFSHLH